MDTKTKNNCVVREDTLMDCRYVGRCGSGGSGGGGRCVWSGMGFTLIELIVVVSILALLMAILLPAVGAARSAAKASATRQFMTSLSISLGMYHTDHREYPASDWRLRNDAATTSEMWDGGEILTQALVGHFGDNNGNKKPDDLVMADDGVVGPGFKTIGTRVYGPYINAGSRDMRAHSDRNGNGQMDDEEEWWEVDSDGVMVGGNANAYVFMDRFDKPVCYYRARSGASSMGGRLLLWNQNASTNSGRFNIRDNRGIDGSLDVENNIDSYGDPADPTPMLGGGYAGDSGGSLADTTLHTAKYVLYSRGKDRKNYMVYVENEKDEDTRIDDIFITGP